jgi:histidinol phosphatase-like PHP family hydrolase
VPFSLQAHPELFDAHVHTEFAHCAEDISVEPALERMRSLGLARPAFAEHADQLYFPLEGFWKRLDVDDPDAVRQAVRDGHSRHEAFRRRMRPFRDAGVRLGLECEPALDGRGLAVLDEDLAGIDYVIGSVHHLAKGDDAAVPEAEIHRRFMARTEQLLRAGVDILAHPFRYFRRYKRPVPRELFRPVAGMLAAAGVAAEINFHTNQPPPEFFAICLELGVRLSLGSDSHSLAEVGELRPHFELLEHLGAAGRLDEILWQPEMARARPG